MTARSSHPARARTKRRARRPTNRQPTTVLARIHPTCVDGLHLWCPGTAGWDHTDTCRCPCHDGHRHTTKGDTT